MSAQIDQYTGPFLSGKSVWLVHNTKQTWIFLMKIFDHFLPVMLIIHLNDAEHAKKKKTSENYGSWNKLEKLRKTELLKGSNSCT